jgi:(E)-4-hydroxy-3-methylbut-2-enyl-diphosphate synthase
MFQGLIKSSSGIGILLYEGFGDTLRVSLTENPVNEVNAGFKILEALNIRKRGFEIISCPTCARCGGNVKYISKIIEKQFLNEPKKLKVAVMGCVVNGPGEAKDADIGIAFGKNDAVLFSDGKLRRKISENAVLKEFIKEIKIKLRNRS